MFVFCEDVFEFFTFYSKLFFHSLPKYFMYDSDSENHFVFLTQFTFMISDTHSDLCDDPASFTVLIHYSRECSAVLLAAFPWQPKQGRFRPVRFDQSSGLCASPPSFKTPANHKCSLWKFWKDCFHFVMETQLVPAASRTLRRTEAHEFIPTWFLLHWCQSHPCI